MLDIRSYFPKYYGYLHLLSDVSIIHVCSQSYAEVILRISQKLWEDASRLCMNVCRISIRNVRIACHAGLPTI